MIFGVPSEMDPKAESIANSVVLIIISVVLTAVAAAVATNSINKRKAEAERDKRIVELEKQIALISASVIPISTAFQAILIKELTHMHTPRLDELLTKVGPPSTMTTGEEEEFYRLLREKVEDLDGLIPEAERDAATMLPLVMKRAKIEAAEPNVIVADGSLLQLVSTPKTAEENDH
jgi:hypothetical protein